MEHVKAVEKMNRNKMCRWICIAMLFLIAYICRLPIIPDAYGREAGLLRSFIYLCLYLGWCFSLRNRIIQVQVRRYLTSIASLMVFWLFIRTIKFHFLPEELYPDIRRYIWYLFYLPMLFIPLFAVFVSMLIGKPEKEKLPVKKVMLLTVPTAALVLLALTNDLHQLVFTFPKDAAVWTDSINGYTYGYYLVVSWLLFCAVMMLVQLYRKRRISSRRWLILLPCIPIIVLLFYMVGYFLQFQWLRLIAGDVSTVICVMYALTLEICVHCGFIQANTHYHELFDASTVGTQITDEEYNVLLSSQTAKSVDKKILRQTVQGPVMLQDGFRLCGAPIRGGHVVWTEDMSPLLNILDELKEAKENLEDGNVILEEENAVKAREAHIAEQDRLYNIIQRDTSQQIRLMDELIRQVEEAEQDEEKRRLLKKMLVIGAYLKRRSNLVFLAAKMSKLEAKELALTFGESMDNLELYGVVCGFNSELKEPVLAVHIMSMYDFFEEITERSLSCMSSITVSVTACADGLCLTVNTDSAADLSSLASDTVRVHQDEDGEWKLILHLITGGEKS